MSSSRDEERQDCLSDPPRLLYSTSEALPMMPHAPDACLQTENDLKKNTILSLNHKMQTRPYDEPLLIGYVLCENIYSSVS